MERVIGFVKRMKITKEKLIVRALTVFFLVNTVSLWVSNTSYANLDYVLSVNIPLFLLLNFVGVLFLCTALTATSTMAIDRILLLIGSMLFFATITFRTNSVYLYTVVCALTAAICYYCFKTDETDRIFKNNKYVTLVVIAVLAVLFVVAVGGLTALRYKMFIAPNFDFGIFAQMFDYMKQTGIPYTTCERDMLLSHFDVHVSFIYYLILPFYYIFSTPYTLNIAQAVILASGVIPLYLLCKKHGLSENMTLAMGIVYIFYPALSAGCFYDIHENCFLTPLILWLMYSVDADNTVGLILSAGLVCSVKEDAPIYVMFIAVYMFFAKKKILKPALLLGFAVGYFLVAVWYLDHHGDGAMLYRYANFSATGGSIKDIIKACVLDPGYVFGQCLNVEKAEFALKILLPLGFLPLFSSKMHRYILLGPFMLINLMSNYPYQHSIDFQYNFGVAALLFYLTVVNSAHFKADRQKIVAGWCVTAALLGTLAFCGGRIGYIDYYKGSEETCSRIEQVIAEIPEDASVYSNTFILPHLYEHDVLYQLNSDNPDLSGRTEYVVIDLRFAENAKLYPLFTENGFVTVAYEDGAAAVLWCPFYVG